MRAGRHTRIVLGPISAEQDNLPLCGTLRAPRSENRLNKPTKSKVINSVGAETRAQEEHPVRPVRETGAGRSHRQQEPLYRLRSMGGHHAE